MGPVLVLLLAAAMPDLTALNRMIARFAPTEIRADTSVLSPGDRRALAKLIEASRVVDDLFLAQMWSGNQALYGKLRNDVTPLGKARLHYFLINKSPWSSLDDFAAFIPGVPPRKLQGANFYPEDMTRAEFEAWAKTLDPAARREAEGFFTVIRRDAAKKLTTVPYSREYRRDLERAAALLREAAAATDNPSLRRFLSLRADAFLSGDYYASDVAWLELDAPLDVTISPYETYNDELFGYKAAFESYVTVRDSRESARLASFSARLQEIENNLPLDARFRNTKLGALSPIRVVNLVFSAGDGNHGVQTAAFNLPNDERVVREKGAKQVMLKNVQEAKFRAVLTPIAAGVLPPAERSALSFDAFFTHILAHELSHAIGPRDIVVAGRKTTPRQELKELYSPIEEAKADVTGLFMLDYLIERGLAEGNMRDIHTTYLASNFRSVRFGVHEAHGKGTAVQFNYFLDKGAYIARPDGTFAVDHARIKGAVRDLARDLLTMEAVGDYAAAREMLDQLAVIRPEMQKALDRMHDIPVDIEPLFVTQP
ncbi:MAG TPA: hypothetical protein VN442_02885 [Bryobacteraceae bacterium]|nr:hypothetical protein [Bryobacteraceae bacterium]